MMMTDREIIQLQRSGRYEQAFNAIVDSYSERLYWHVRRFLYNHHDTDDLLQEIFIKIWKGLPSFKGDSQIFTWAYRIATNETLNYLKSSRKRITVEIAEKMISGTADDDTHFNGDMLQRELHKAMESLPDKQKEVFSLRYFDEMKYEDISEITGTSVGALKASYHHAYRKVSEMLKKLFIH